MDWKDIKPGDKFAVEFTAKASVGADGFIPVSDGWVQTQGNSLYPTSETIRRRLVSITPKPYEPKVGDMVTWGTGVVAFEVLWLDKKNFLLRSSKDDKPLLYHTPLVNLPQLRPA